MTRKILPVAVAIITLGIGAGAFAADAPGFVDVEMKGGNFSPANIEIPANQKIVLKVKNSESSLVEFESYSLNREVKIKPGETTDIYVGPLKPGNYDVFDDNNPDAKGTVVAK